MKKLNASPFSTLRSSVENFLLILFPTHSKKGEELNKNLVWEPMNDQSIR